MRLRNRLRRLAWRLLGPLVRRFAQVPTVAANFPDYPVTDRERWLILDRGHWGTLAATKVGGGRILLSVWKGYEQTAGGVLLTRAQILALVDYEEDRRGA